MDNSAKELMAPPLQGEGESLREIFNIKYLETEKRFKARAMIAVCSLYLIGIIGIAFCWWWYFPKWNPPNIDPHITISLIVVTLLGIIVLGIIERIISKVVSNKFYLHKSILMESGRKLRDAINEAWDNNKTRAQLAEEVEDILNNPVFVKKTNGKYVSSPTPFTSSDVEKILNKVTKNRTISITSLPSEPEDH